MPACFIFPEWSKVLVFKDELFVQFRNLGKISLYAKRGVLLYMSN